MRIVVFQDISYDQKEKVKKTVNDKCIKNSINCFEKEVSKPLKLSLLRILYAQIFVILNAKNVVCGFLKML